MDKEQTHADEGVDPGKQMELDQGEGQTVDCSKPRRFLILPSHVSMHRSKVRISSVVTGQTFGADDTILKKVSKGRLYGNVKMTKHLQKCDIIIIFCPIISRVGSDVEAALGNMAGHKPAILVLMHHTRDVDYSTSGRKWSEKYPNVKLELHVLYHETLPGLLDCQQNKEAIKEIQKEIYKHSR
ncbi:hypothetical protein Q5P01_000031 [Channa striata]|uniref:Uncharacterized protein n=1 Tax=Channa striata TaxID=64152 RepID=A0AA88IWA4_CHASR|nr:hypothetical protein Q5P01_000031 [Channa striata]